MSESTKSAPAGSVPVEKPAEVTAPAKNTAAKKTAAKSTPAKKKAKSKRLTTEQKRRIIMRGDGWPDPAFKLAGSGVRFLDDEEAQEAMEQAVRENEPGYRDEADIPQPGERELTEDERALTEDEIAEIAEYEQALAGGPKA